MSATPSYPPPPPVAPAPAGRPWGAGRIILLVLGVLAALLAFGLLAAGCATLWADQTQRDDDGFLTTGSETFETDGYAIVSERFDIDEETPSWVLSESFIGEIRFRVESDSGEVFAGIGPADDVASYLDGVAYSEVTELRFDPFRADYRDSPGGAPDGPPGSETFWTVTATGSGEQTLTWEPERGDWSVVVMNADASQGVEADVSIGAEAGFLGWLAAVLLIAGVVVLAVAGLLIFLAVRSGAPAAYPPAVAAAAAAPGEEQSAVPAAAAPAGGSPPLAVGDYPVAVRGDLDPGLGRWLWLVKWLLVIPHVVVLLFLWVAFFVLTVIAFFAILFTGRYPRGIFDFNVGVIRWTWRAWFYAYWANGTDRYPPFTLDPDPSYPADFHVAYPERLSRGLVLVKWWLLAIPHYIIVGILVGSGGWGWWWDDAWGRGGGWPGLVVILVIIAAVALLFTGSYPRGLYDLVLGFDRWALRVWAYAALMRDEYPPFRLDTGPREPQPAVSTTTAAEPEPEPDGETEA